MNAILEQPIRKIMQTDVTTVTPDMSVRELTRLLSDEGISGVPVVTAGGGLVGVVSTSDITRMAAAAPGSTFPISGVRGGRGVPEDNFDADDEGVYFGDFFLPAEGPVPFWDDTEGEDVFDGLAVEDIMTDMAFTVDPDLTVRELASYLIRGRIHRAVVTDDRDLVGIVTTMDVLRVVAEGS